MIDYSRFTLNNGLRLLVHTDTSTPMVALNLLYRVGSRDEHPEHTGFAHLFEHLMFGGSLHVPSFDQELDNAGGENNAYTTSDYTNYYMQVPAANVETGFRLESDRMLALSMSEKVLEVQRSVVIEEFKQNYQNKPYGDLWLELKPLAFRKHPYRWATIGADMSHISGATLDEVKAFFQRFYHPANAILSVAGNITAERALELTTKWFEEIPGGIPNGLHHPAEPVQSALRSLTLFRDVPYDVALMAWKMPGRDDPDYQVYELLAELLAGGDSSLLLTKLVKETELLTEVECFLSEEVDHGLFCLFLKPRLENSLYQCVEEVSTLLEQMFRQQVVASNLEKVKNKALTAIALGQMSVHNKATSLAFGEFLGDADRINREPLRYQQTTAEELTATARQLFRPDGCSILYYRRKNIDAG